MKKTIISNRKPLALILAFVIAFSLTVSPLFALANGGYSDKKTEIQILHTNDIHGYYTYSSRGAMGFGYLKALAEREQADLIVDAGDTYHGQAFATVEKGRSIAELMREVGYDCMTVGNHDWSYGAPRLKELEKLQGFPILAANVSNSTGKSYFDTPYIVKEVTADDGTEIKVGVFGVTDDSFYNSTASENVKDIHFTPESETATKLAKTLREKEGCQIVVGLTHNSDCVEFIKNTKGIDAVIAGHEHIVMDKACKDADGKTVALVEAGSYFNQAGVLTLTYNSEKNCVEDFNEKVYTNGDLADLTADSRVVAKTAEIEERQSDVLSAVIGRSEEEYPYTWEEVRCGEQAIGRIITAAYINRTGADIAFENAGGIRSGIPAGNITYKDVISISPYGNTLLTKEMTGSQILELLEYSIELSRQCDDVYQLQKKAVENGEDPYQYTFPEESGSVLQFGGMTVEYSLEKPAGNRVVSVKIGNEFINPERIYTVVTNNYVAENTDYKGLAESPVKKEYGTCEEALQEYISRCDFEAAAKTPCLIEANVSKLDTNESVTRDDTAKTETAAEQKLSPQTGNDFQNSQVYFFAALGAVTMIFCVRSLKKKESR